MSVIDDVKKMAGAAKGASRVLALASLKSKDRALTRAAEIIKKSSGSIVRENNKDVKSAKSKRMPKAFIDRLTLNPSRIGGMISSLKKIAELSDVVGRVDNMHRMPNGLWIGKERVPIGVIGIVYESRPNVTVDCAALCVKSGNSVILRGGSESINSNIALFKCLKQAFKEAGLPEGAVNIITHTGREAVRALIRMKGLVDLVIPRGGESLINEVSRYSKVPVIRHYKGICHVYVDESADLNMAEKIAINAKVQRPGVCNAMETLLVHKEIAARFLPSLIKKLKDAGCEIRGCDVTRHIVKGIKKASEKDWRTEYLDLILSIKVVSDISEAIEHINKFGSSHSEAIVTEDYGNANRFLKEIDSACVYVNASTRFTDGGEFGMGAEIGISTDRLHARGPMGLEELTTYKYIILGDGQVRK
ncbi:MAG: glutamate-5-semialdehyde dehydrogenase [Candidatus Omnitrophica bacterium CG1_02_49_10]|nr:MAG: glutamate-5-semialdehyde dehydrogenase [Candidatus Omnitrophica bacterium CG1_02_49_10]